MKSYTERCDNKVQQGMVMVLGFLLAVCALHTLGCSSTSGHPEVASVVAPVAPPIPEPMAAAPSTPDVAPSPTEAPPPGGATRTPTLIKYVFVIAMENRD